MFQNVAVKMVEQNSIADNQTKLSFRSFSLQQKDNLQLIKLTNFKTPGNAEPCCKCDGPSEGGYEDM